MPVRIAHAVAFAIVDRSHSGHERLAFSNFFGAAASGFIGTAYLPGGYNDLTHAGQRTANTLGGFALSNMANESVLSGPTVNSRKLLLLLRQVTKTNCNEQLNTGTQAQEKMMSTGFSGCIRPLVLLPTSALLCWFLTPNVCAVSCPAPALSFTLTLYSWERLATEVIPRRAEYVLMAITFNIMQPQDRSCC